ncbi:MAG TPA: tyrosine-type recombinase/integrase [Casimicrobiaceae bacterium]|nr:tyrosine-type recombinase/integrase [Casimicrobiaceae bacterium]
MRHKRHKFTVRFIESLKPRATPFEKPDADVKGLLVRVQPSGVKSFIVQYGRGKRTTLDKHYPVCTIEAARTQALEILRDAKHGTPAAVKAKAKIVTLDGFLTEHYGPWVITERKAGKATVANLRAQFGPLFGKKPLTEITAWNVEKFKASRLKSGIKPATVNRDLDRIRAALNKAVEWGLLERNPISGVKRSKGGDASRVRYLDIAEEARLRKALVARDSERRRQRASGNAWGKARGQDARHLWAKGEFTDHLAPIVLLALNTGLRRGELLGLAWDRVNLDRAQLTVTPGTAKSGQVRHVPLNAEALDVLTRWKKQGSGNGLVFPGDEGARFTHINRSWASLVLAAELKDFHFHDCRHHFASWLVMAGADLYTVSKLLGHSDTTMTQRYAHLSPEHNAAAVARLMAKR